MTGFVFHPEAENDLNEIWEFLAESSLDAADRVVGEIRDAVEGLLRFPHQGYRRPDLTSSSLRFWRVRGYLIAYNPEAAPLLGCRHPRPPEPKGDGRHSQRQGVAQTLCEDGA